MKKIIAMASIALTASMVMPALAQTSSTTSASTSAAIVCVGTAVAVRESSLDAGIATQAQAISSAYAARATALQQAYAMTTVSQVRSAVRAAWATFNTSLRNTSKAWRTTRDAAWSKFRTAVKACKAPTDVNDSANASSEATGQ